jgi:16S rRNA processing protein RimM
MLKVGSYFIGTFVKTHGIKGDLILKSEKVLSPEFEETETVFVEVDGLPVPFFISPEGIRIRADYSAIIKLDDIDSETDAKEFVGCRLLIKKGTSVDPDPLEIFSIKDLIGYFIINQAGEAIGEVAEITGVERNPLLKVIYRGREVLVPYNKDLIIARNEEKKTITISIPEGLLEL